MDACPHRNRRLLFLAMYPVDRENKAAVVRIRALRSAFEERLGDALIFVAGDMRARRRELRRLMRSGDWRTIDDVYVEAHSTSAGLADLVALRKLKRHAKNITIYVRDAYPLFRDLAVHRGPRAFFVHLAFRVSLAVYRSVATRLGFPSRGLADAVAAGDPRVIILPPGMHATAASTPSVDGRFLLVGGSAGIANGVDLFVEAARRRPNARFVWCGQKRYTDAIGDWSLPSNFERVEWDRDGIVRELDSVKAFLIPRQVTPYTNLCVPIKLMDYMSWQRPIIATRCTETAAILADTGMGFVVDGTVDGLTQGIDRVDAMDATELAAFTARAEAAHANYAWSVLAERILGTFPDDRATSATP